MLTAKIATGQFEAERKQASSAAAPLGRLGGEKRVVNMTPERRTEIAKAAVARR